MRQNNIRFAYAGDRDISVWVLKFILDAGYKPDFLLIPESKNASHSKELLNLCTFLPESHIFSGKEFRLPKSIELLRNANLDYIFGIHFPSIIPQEVLEIPSEGVLNLHPAYLPFNRGWHTPTWAILDGTPIGATLHFMEKEVDTGNIISQRKLNIQPDDTANSLYQRLKQLEFELFKETWPELLAKSYTVTKQDLQLGSTHKKKDLFDSGVQEIGLNENVKAGDLIRKLRALTTNRIDEAAFFYLQNKKYKLRIEITEDE